MSLYDEKYLSIVKDILDNGYYDNNRTGMPTYKLPHQIMQFNLQKEFPILTTKFVAFKTAVKEMLWIYQKQSNVVEDLRQMNVKIWNEWEGEDGTIGKREVVCDFKVGKQKNGGWLITDDSELNAYLKYDQGNDIAQYIISSYNDWLQETTLAEQEAFLEKQLSEVK